MIVVRVDHDLEDVGFHVGVATHESRDDVLRAVLLEHPRADVQRVVVEEEAHLHPLRGRLALVGIDLGELGDRCGLRPTLLVQPAVDGDAADLLGGDGRRDRHAVR